MNDKLFWGCSNCYRRESEKKDFDALRKELTEVKNNMRAIERMNLSQEVTKLVKSELEKQINNIKEKMHECIEEM